MKLSHSLVACTLATAIISNWVAAQVPTSVEFKVGVETASTKRNVSLSDAIVDRASSSIRGLEAELTPLSGGPGIGGRILDGTFGDATMSFKEGKFFLGEDVFRVEGGYGQRSMFGTDSLILFSRVGARSTIRIGGSGVAVTMSGSKYFKGDFTSKKNETSTTTTPTDADGWEGETGVSYSTMKVPVFVQVGYRSEYFKYGARAEHLSGLILQTGLWLGGR
jgi:hypothetical protein